MVNGRTVLILAYYFPPMGLGGVQRVQKFVKYLPQYGWRPVVVTVRDVEYHTRDETLLQELPPETRICRTGSLDPLRLAHRFGKSNPAGAGTAAAGRALARWVLFPDHQIGWAPFAVVNARRIMRTERIDAIFSTFPPGSCHVAGYLLNRMTGVPWIADFRDGWTGGEFDQTPSAAHAALQRLLERVIVRRATHLLAVTDKIAEQLSKIRGSASDVTVLTNGYDPDDFTGLERPVRNDRLVITYCGTLNTARSPEPLFRALRYLFDRSAGLEALLEVRLVGASIGLDLHGMIRYYHLENVVTHTGYLAHRAALAQVVASDALLLFITSDERRAAGVPTGKLYECLAAGRPVLSIASGGGDDLLHAFGRGTTVSPADIEGIARVIKDWMGQHASGTLPVYPADDAAVRMYSRPYLTECLARILNDVAIA